MAFFSLGESACPCLLALASCTATGASAISSTTATGRLLSDAWTNPASVLRDGRLEPPLWVLQHVDLLRPVVPSKAALTDADQLQVLAHDVRDDRVGRLRHQDLLPPRAPAQLGAAVDRRRPVVAV